jgi:type II secretory pathway pseudopilin PulG
VTITSKLVESARLRSFGSLFAELVLIVAGILIALAIDGWVSDRQDRQQEEMYLELLLRDIGEQQQEAAAQFAFEKDKVEKAHRAYTLLVGEDPAIHEPELGALLTDLSVRRTIHISSATYDQIVSNGELQLIRNHELRDQVVRHFASMARNQSIISKNNQDLVDDIYSPFLVGVGISIKFGAGGTEAPANRGMEILRDVLGQDFSTVANPVLQRSPDAESWDDIRRNVLFRMRIAAVGQALAETLATDTQVMARALQTELEGRARELR